MDEPINIDLVPDDEEFGRLRSYEGDILASAVYNSCVNYKVYCPVRVHGHGQFEGKTHAASLLVFSLRSSAKSKRRIKTISLEIEFAVSETAGTTVLGPQVLNLAPDEQKILLDCTVEDQENTATTEGTMGVSGGTSVASANASVTKKNEKKISKSVKFSVQVWGSPYPSQENMNYSDTVSWNAEENSDQEHGVPPVVRLPVLILRPQNGNFLCKIKVMETLHWGNPFPEWWYKIQKWSNNRKPKVWKVDVGQSRQDGSIIEDELEKYLDDELMKKLVRIDMPLTWEDYKDSLK